MLEHALDGIVRVKVKPGMPRSEILGWDENISAIRVNLHAKAEDNKANVELVRVLRKATGKNIEIISGGRARLKTIRIS